MISAVIYDISLINIFNSFFVCTVNYTLGGANYIFSEIISLVTKPIKSNNYE